MSRRYPFFGLLNRMRLIQRWSLMRKLSPENIAEHSFDVAILAHHLAHLRRLRFAGPGRVLPDPRRVMELALFHDVTEIITGDLPTPVKYHDPRLREAFRSLEVTAADRLLSLLPEDLQACYEDLLKPESLATDNEEEQEALRLVKAADKLSAWLKCYQETQQGNTEFVPALQTTRAALEAMQLPEVDCFLEEFAPSYGLPLDELT